MHRSNSLFIKVLSITFIAFLLIMLVPAQVDAEDLPDSVIQSPSLTIALLIYEPYYHYGLTYPSDLYYTSALAVYQALVYMGIPTDIVTTDISQTELNEYGGLIVIRGGGTTWALTQEYAETTGNPVLWFYIRGGDATMNVELGLSDAGQVAAGDVGASTGASLINNATITVDLSDDYGMLSSFSSRNLTFNSTFSTWTSYIVNAGNTSQPYLFSATHDNAIYYIYATAAGWIGTSGNGQYIQQLLMNYARIAMPNLIRWTPLPGAQDTGLFIRADDAADLSDNWTQFWARYPHSTTSAQASLDQATANYIMAAADDYVPHGYSHEDFSTLSYAQQYSLLEQINAAWEARFGERPYYYVMPYNRADTNTGMAMDATDGLLYTTLAASTGYPAPYYYMNFNNSAVTVGDYWPSGNLSDYVDRLMDQGGVGSVVIHPYSLDWTTLTGECDYLINITLTNSGVMLTTLSEVADIYVARQGITMDDGYIQFGTDTPSGLTMEYRYLDGGKTIKVGDLVLPRIGDRVIFPAMDAGVYEYELVDLADYTIVTSVTAGLVLKDGSYNTSTDVTTITVEGWATNNATVVGNITLSSTPSGLSLMDGSYNELSDIENNTALTLTPGNYFIMGQDGIMQHMFDDIVVIILPLFVFTIVIGLVASIGKKHM
jgi:peptidoglycan/xylan/chitin deacetylase (PgdA/CDA1 family)